MYHIAVDTTASHCSVGLFENETVVDIYSETFEFGQAEVLLPKIAELLQTAKLTFQDIGMVSVCVGPGSFTGVRASVSAVKTFALVDKNLKLNGINAFDVYFSMLKPEELAERNVVIIETKREDFYYQIFDKNQNAVSEPNAANREEIIKQLNGFAVSMVGDGVERFCSLPTGLHLHNLSLSDGIDIKAFGALAYLQYQNKRFSFPKPLYLRAPDICVKAV